MEKGISDGLQVPHLSDLPGRDEVIVEERARDSLRKRAHLGLSNDGERVRETWRRLTLRFLHRQPLFNLPHPRSRGSTAGNGSAKLSSRQESASFCLA